MNPEAPLVMPRRSARTWQIDETLRSSGVESNWMPELAGIPGPYWLPMTFTEAQRDMRQAYYGGATGLFASATAWLAAGIVCLLSTPANAILTLLVGGMLIFPCSVVLSKAVGRTGFHAKGNPLGALALESTLWLLLAVPIAYGAAMYRVEWFFPAMLLTIGGRYLTFSTLYGTRVYWICGVTLATTAAGLVVIRAPAPSGAFAGAIVEYVFAALVFTVNYRSAA